MAPWQMKEFMREKVERSRRLLAEPGEQHGSADLRARTEAMGRFVRSMDWVVDLHRTFLDESGEKRQALSERERLQGMATFACYMSAQLETASVVFVVDPACYHALEDALSWARAAGRPDLTLLSVLGLCATVIVTDPAVGSEGFQAAHRVVAGLAQGWAAIEGAALQLERRQRQAGLDPLLTALATQRLTLQLHAYLVNRWAPVVGAPAQALDMLAAAAQSCASLVALEPANAGFLWSNAMALGRMGSSAQAAAGHRRALAAAEESRDHYNLFQNADALLNLLTAGAEGPRWQLAEARRLLGQAQRALALSRPALQKDIYNEHKAHLAGMMGEVERTAASFPGVQLLPALPRMWGVLPMQISNTCDACGKQALILRACAACHAVSYCSKECQVRHWRAPEGGHKAECAALAAARHADATGSISS